MSFIISDLEFPIYVQTKNHEGFIYLINLSEVHKQSLHEVYLRSLVERIIPKLEKIAKTEKLFALTIIIDGKFFDLIPYLNKKGFNATDDMVAMVLSLMDYDKKNIKIKKLSNKYYEIVQFKLQDLNDWISVIQQSFKRNDERDITLHNFRKYWLDDPAFESELHLAIRDTRNNRLVGIISGFYYPEKKMSHIKLVAVVRDYQNQGIGSNLLAMLLERLLERNCLYVTLDVNINNKPAICLYRKFGFVFAYPIALRKVFPIEKLNA